jgi:hypothetical protein
MVLEIEVESTVFPVSNSLKYIEPVKYVTGSLNLLFTVFHLIRQSCAPFANILF